MTGSLRRSSGSNSSSDPREDLLMVLRTVPFATYQLTMFLLLQRLGYRDVRFLGREHLRGRISGSVGDFQVEWPNRFGVTRVLVEIKQEARDFQRRYIDALRGRMLSGGFSEGLVITTGTISDPADEAAKAFPSLPITLVDGKTLAELMVSKEFGITTGAKVEVDKEFFRRLLRVGLASQTKGCR